MTLARLTAACAAVTLAAMLAACVPAVIAVGVGGAAMVAGDRRTAGAQVDDETIEFKVADQIRTLYGDRVHVNVTSYNGIVLLTGEVPDTGAAASIATAAKGIEKVRVVHNEVVVVVPNSELSARTNDSFITSKVKGRFVEANKFPPNAVKVVTERAVVYLMGIVSKQEGTAAGEIAASTEGVARVVKVFEYRG